MFGLLQSPSSGTLFLIDTIDPLVQDISKCPNFRDPKHSNATLCVMFVVGVSVSVCSALFVEYALILLSLKRQLNSEV